jgi:hypothetical protein
MAGRLPPTAGHWSSRPPNALGRDPTRLRSVGRQFALDNLRSLTEIMGARDITSVLANGGNCS